VTLRTLLLTPSRGLGGGIERYADTVEWSLNAEGVDCHRIDLRGSGPAAHARLLAEARGELHSADVPTRLVVAHRALLPAASVLGREHQVSGISVLCHGIDVWSPRIRIRRLVEGYLLHRPHVRVVAVSSFTAGVLSDECHATVLPPGLSQPWFDMLVEASASVQRGCSTIQVVTAFRLAEWQNKGLPQLLDAVAGLRRFDIRLTVCGSGNAAPELRALVQGYGFCILKVGLSDHELARELADADVFVLATRTRSGRRASGEGFGLVLLEAQVAGTPVIGPAFGGSHEAFVDRITGVAPGDETADSLRMVLEELLRDRAELARMGRLAGQWARESFAPKTYASRAVARLL
jgi:phosphatidylinositol alpha-1,6-mannosyltransferase